MKRIAEFEVIDLGIESPDYFQGFGCAFTSFDNCAVGIGDNPAEALDDCLETIAQMGIDTEDLETRIRAREDEPPTAPVAPEGAYYHIGIRWR